MKKLTLILFILIGYVAFSQTLTLFDIDPSNFPTIRAKFYAIDKDGKQIISLSPSDFELKENGIKRNITFVSCPTPKPPQALSSVLVMDVSGSMADGAPNIMLAKEAARAWVETLPLGKSECAITSFDNKNYLNQDFTTDKDKLLNAIYSLAPQGGTDYDEALLNPPAGGLIVAQNGKYKRVIVFLTDGQPNKEPQTAQIIQEAKRLGVAIYAVIVGMACPQSVKEITTQTGGLWFEKVTSVEEARQIYLLILGLAQGGEPCTIEWQSDFACESNFINVELNLLINGAKTTNTYYSPRNSIIRLEIKPVFLKFIQPKFGEKNEQKINITAINGDFIVRDIKASSNAFDVTPKKFILRAGKSRELTVSFTPTDSAYYFCKFEIVNDKCPATFFASGGWKGKKPTEKTLKLTHPNGGEIFVVGSDTVITWEGISNDDLVELEYSIDSGRTWKFIDTARGLRYVWKNIPRPASEKCLVRVKQLDEEQGNETKYKLKWTTPAIGGNVFWSADGNKIATFGGSSVTVLDANTLGKIALFPGNSGYITSISLSRDGSEIAVGGKDDTIRVFDAETGGLIFQIINPNGVYKICFSQDGKTIATTKGNEPVRIWDVQTGQLLQSFIPLDNVHDIALSPDGDTIGILYFNRIEIGDIKTGSILKKIRGFINNNYRTYVAFSPDGKLIAVNGSPGVYLFDLQNGALLQLLLYNDGYPSCMCFSPDGTQIAVGYNEGSIITWDVSTGTSIKTFKKHNSLVSDVSYSPDGNQIASVSGDGTLKIWDVATGNLLRQTFGHREPVTKAIFSPDNQFVASGSYDLTVKIWDKSSGTLTNYLAKEKFWVTDISYEPFGSKLVSCNYTDINLWDLKTGTIWGSIRLKRDTDLVYKSCFSPDGNIIAFASNNGKILIWNLVTGDVAFKFPGHLASVRTVCFSPDGSRLVSGSEDRTIKIWDFASESLLQTLSGHLGWINSVCYSPDGSKIASGSVDKTIKIWDANSGTLLKTLKGHSSEISSVNFSPDSKKIVSASWGEIKIWDVELGTELQTLTEQNGAINSVSFSPDGRYIVSCGSDATVRVWTLDNVLQEDESDSVFSIVEPMVQALDVDMGKVLVGSVKDSVVAGFIRNTGSWKFRVDSIYFRGADASAFSLVSGFPKYEVKPGDTHYGEFRFKPSRIGIHNAEIVIITQSDTLVQTIRGEGVDPQLQVSTDVLDFGTVEIGDEKIIRDTLLLKNISNNAITITNTVLTYPDKEQFEIVDGGGSFVLQPNEGRKLSIKFKPKYGGRTSGGVGFEYNGVGSPVVAQLFGTGIGGRVYLPRDSGYAGETKIYKLTLANIKPEGLMAIANQFRARIRFQSTILAAPTITEKEFLSDSTYITIRGTLSNSSILAEIPFVAGLGSVEETSIDIVEMKIFDSNGNEVEYDFEKESGQFTLLGICNEGGKRLINPGKVTQLLKIAPNPSDGNVKIELNLVEDGTTILRIYNWQGVAIEERRYTEAGKGEITLNTENYATGLYLVELQTPTIVKRELLIISR